MVYVQSIVERDLPLLRERSSSAVHQNAKRAEDSFVVASRCWGNRNQNQRRVVPAVCYNRPRIKVDFRYRIVWSA